MKKILSQRKLAVDSSNKHKKHNSPEWLSRNIASALKSVEILFLLYLCFLLYWIFAVIGTSDWNIAVHKSVYLPILNHEISLNGFFVCAPVIATLLFIACQIRLKRLKSMIKDLWINDHSKDMKRVEFWTSERLNPSSSWLLKIGHGMTMKIIFWASLPLCMILNALWYLRSHQPGCSYTVCLLGLVGTFIVIWLKRRYHSMHREISFSLKALQLAFVLSVIIFQVILLLFLIPWANEGFLPRIVNMSRAGQPLRRLTCVDLSYRNLTAPREIHSRRFFGVDFSRAHLEGALLQHSVFLDADLKRARLKNAFMNSAILDKVNLKFANLVQADLMNATLRGADLSRANLIGAYCRDTNLQDAILRSADLRAVRLLYADAQRADLSMANFEGANLFQVDLREAKLRGANFRNASLIKSSFINADLKNADLQGAYLWKANFTGANLSEVNLLGAEQLEVDQLSEAKTLYKAKLEPDLLKRISDKFPYLLEQPEEGDV